MAKFFVILFCLSAACFVWTTEASPFFFNVQKSYVTQPAQANSRTTVAPNTDFGLSGLVSKWLALSQIFTDKLVGKTTQRPRATQRPVVKVQSEYVAEKLSTTTTKSPAEEIDSSTAKQATTESNTTTRTTPEEAATEGAPAPDSFTTPDRFTTEDTDGLSIDIFSTEGTATGPTTAKQTTDDKDTETDVDADGSDTDGSTASTADLTTGSQGYEFPTTSTAASTASDGTTNGYAYTTPSTTSPTTTFSTSSNGYDLTAPYTTPIPTSDLTTATTPHGYAYQTPPTPSAAFSSEHTPPSTDSPPTTYRPKLFTTESSKDNEIHSSEDNANAIRPTGGDSQPPRAYAYFPQVLTRFSSASDGGASANAISAGRVSTGGLSANSVLSGSVAAGGVSIGDASAVPQAAKTLFGAGLSAGGLSANSVFSGSVSAGGVSIGDASVSQSAKESPVDILSVNEREDSSDGRKFQGTIDEAVDETTGGIDPRLYRYYFR